MKRAEKEAFVADFTKSLDASQAFALMSFSNIKVEDMTEFRKTLRKNNVRVRVVKNTLAKRVFGNNEAYGQLGEGLTGPTLVAYSDKADGDAVQAMKAIWEWADKKEFNVKVKSGAAMGESMAVAQLQALSKLPGREELLVSFLFALKHHPTNFLYALKDAPTRLGYAFGALKEKREKDGAS